jgi:hypothetical protein
VRVVQVVADEVVDVVAVGDGLVSAVWSVFVAGFVLVAVVLGGAFGRVEVADLDCV